MANQPMSMSASDLGLGQNPLNPLQPNMATTVKKKKPAFNYGQKSPAANSLGVNPQTLTQLGGV